jgi:hypothetical protein
MTQKNLPLNKPDELDEIMYLFIGEFFDFPQIGTLRTDTVALKVSS